QRTFRASAPDDVRRPMDPSRILSREEHPEPLEGGAVFPELGAHRSVDARDVRPPPDFVQDGRVAVPDDELRALLDEVRGQIGNDALQAVAAARQDQRLGARVLQGMAKLVEPPLVVAREIAEVAVEDALAVPRLEADVLQGADAALEAFLVERAGRRDYRDSVAGPERGRTRHPLMLAYPRARGREENALPACAPRLRASSRARSVTGVTGPRALRAIFCALVPARDPR